MTEDMPYTTSNTYHLLGPPGYYSAPHATHNHSHFNPHHRIDNTQRKRPKYTRSKTGCMTCRMKKVKCDEIKPNCTRCTNGQRECIWPEGVSTLRNEFIRKDSEEGRPSTAGSSGLSDGSTPPTREHTPSRRGSVDIGPLPSHSRGRRSEPYILHPLSTLSDPGRRVTPNSDRAASGYPPPGNPALLMMPETYPTQSRYEHYSYHSSRTAGFRALHHEPAGHWNGHEYFSGQERSLAAHMPADSHTRYQ